jgi:hypothetical protein
MSGFLRFSLTLRALGMSSFPPLIWRHPIIHQLIGLVRVFLFWVQNFRTPARLGVIHQ